MLNPNQRLDNLIVGMLSSNKIKMPTQPEIAVRIRECAEDPQLTSSKLAKVISQDPGLTAKFINIANSPLIRGAVTIDSLPEAISRLGMVFVTNTSTGLAMEQLFQATNETVDEILYAVWKDSTKIAAYSHVFAKHFSNIPPDKAALAGLMSHIGVLPLVVYSQEIDELVKNKNELIKNIRAYHNTIGAFLLRAWEFPPEIAEVPQRIQETRKLENVDLTSIVIIAIINACPHKINFITIEDSVLNSIKTAFPQIEEVMQSEAFATHLSASMKFYSEE